MTKSIGAALLDFQGEIDLGGLAFLDFDVLGRRARFAMGGLNLVFAGRDIGDLERPSLPETAK